MADADDPEKVIATLREQITETRKRRMATQKALSAIPNLEIALDRAARDRSTGATDETDTLRQEILTLRDDIMQKVRGVDKTRDLFALIDAEYPHLEPRARLIKELNAEARWRNEVRSDERSARLRIVPPAAEEIA
ncbi:hypothetical protein LG293_17510 (plasmid) [Citricoccus nitrophenolicus]